MPSKRGQGATEYLIILAIVIIIGLIVIGVLRGVPSQGTAAKSRSDTSFWQSSVIGITDHAIDPTGVTLFIRNNNAFPITLDNIKFDTTNVYTSNIGLEAGATQKVTSTVITCTSGNRYSYDVTIAYTNDQTSADYTFTGLGNKLEGTCAGS
jgi:LEA14-like dessication related protein